MTADADGPARCRVCGCVEQIACQHRTRRASPEILARLSLHVGDSIPIPALTCGWHEPDLCIACHEEEQQAIAAGLSPRSARASAAKALLDLGWQHPARELTDAFVDGYQDAVRIGARHLTDPGYAAGYDTVVLSDLDDLHRQIIEQTGSNT